MATEVYTKQEITLQDGTKVILKPSTLKYQRLFLNAWDKISEVKENDDVFDVYVNCSGIGLVRQLQDKVKLLDENGEPDPDAKHVDPDTGELHAQYREYLEETLDVETINKVLEVTGGLKLTVDPKEVEDRKMELKELAGSTSTS